MSAAKIGAMAGHGMAFQPLLADAKGIEAEPDIDVGGWDTLPLHQIGEHQRRFFAVRPEVELDGDTGIELNAGQGLGEGVRGRRQRVAVIGDRPGKHE